MSNEETKRRSFAVRANIWVLRLTRNWLTIVLVFLGGFATGPLIAPVLMQLGATGPADALYTLYSPMCHQFAFRSIFLFGEQGFYPREAADTDLRPYEAYVADDPTFYDDWERFGWFSAEAAAVPNNFERSFWEPARFFIGNEQMGYKTAVCARDTSIYLALFAGGLIYAIPYVRRRLRPIPLWLWVIAGIGPIAMDGGSQLLSYPPFGLWPVRETEPFFRVATGAFFGLMNAWLGFPYIEASMRDTRREIEYKLAKAGIDV